MSNKETALKFVERVINGHDLNAIDQLLSADFVEHSAPPGFASNRAGVKEMFGAFLAAFPDMHLKIDDVIVEGDKVVMRAMATGTHKGPFMGIPATNESFSINEIHIVQVRGEQHVTQRGVVDMMAMMRQIGVTPPPGASLSVANPGPQFAALGPRAPHEPVMPECRQISQSEVRTDRDTV